MEVSVRIQEKLIMLILYIPNNSKAPKDLLPYIDSSPCLLIKFNEKDNKKKYLYTLIKFPPIFYFASQRLLINPLKDLFALA